MCSYKISIFTNFFKIYSIYNILLQTIFWTTQHFFNTRCHCTEYYKYSQISPKHHTWLKIQNSITIFRDYLLAFQNSCQLKLFFTHHFACIVSPTVSFKNSLINHCCFGTSTASPWAKATFLYMFFFQFANHQNVMEEEHTKEPSHNNPEEAANYVKAVNTLLQSFVNDICGFNCYA